MRVPLFQGEAHVHHGVAVSFEETNNGNILRVRDTERGQSVEVPIKLIKEALEDEWVWDAGHSRRSRLNGG